MAEAKVGRHSRWLRAGLAPAMAWLLLSPAAPAFETLEGWTEQRDRSGIRIYTAEVRGSRYRAFRGVTLLCAPIAELIRVNRDVDGFADWLPDLEEARMLERQALEQTHYIRSTTPFPLRDRDMIYHLEVQEPPDADDVRITLTGLPDRLPAEPEVVRMSAARGGCGSAPWARTAPKALNPVVFAASGFACCAPSLAHPLWARFARPNLRPADSSRRSHSSGCTWSREGKCPPGSPIAVSCAIPT